MSNERKMKDSGIEWIGEIPEGWKVVKTKTVFNNCKEIIGDRVDNYERLSLTLNGVLRRSKEDSNGLQPTKFEGYQILRENELVFKLIDLENVNTSRVGLSPYTGLVSPAYIVLNNKDASKFGYYYFLSLWHREIFNKLGGDGVRSNLNVKDLLAIPYLLIPKSEQQIIANYLDQKVSEINHILEKTKESIEEYNKYKQSLITETVTKGLNPEVKMKNSGIDWIGEIPEDWETIKMRNIGTFSASGIDKLINPGEPLVRIINYTDVYGNKTLLLDDKDYMIVSANEDKIKNHLVEEGDLIFTPSSETIEDIGVSALVNKALPNTTFSYHVLRFQFNRDVFKNYKKYLCNNHYVQNVFSSRATGSIRKTLNRADFKNLIVILPTIDEQQQIANYLDQKTSQIDTLISQKEQLISELESYKKSLIYECVTGKREVV